MISFNELTADTVGEIAASLSNNAEMADYFSEIADSFLSLKEEVGVEAAITLFADCVLVRIYADGSYLFVYPIALCDGADVRSACLAVAEYSRKELLPLSFTDVPREDMGLLSEMFPHMDASAYEDDEDVFFVSVKNECNMSDRELSFTEGEITLAHLTDCDRDSYAALCSDTELNRFWGYDAAVDNPDCDPDFYLRVARREFEDGVAIALAVRWQENFIGEAVIYDFDYMGAAAIGVRLLPAYHHRGIGSAATRALISLCRELGLEEVRTSVAVENYPSVAMTDKLMKRVGEEDGNILYSLKL